MGKDKRQRVLQQEQEEKKPWEDPKLTFVEPKLTKHGELKEVTGQFFGGFSP